MAAPPNHFKIGLFVILACCAAVGTAVALGAERIKKDTVRYHTYFDESVHGLDVGAPVQFRGVSIGAVGAISVAPDHRLVDVVEDLDLGAIRRMGLSDPHSGRA